MCSNTCCLVPKLFWLYIFFIFFYKALHVEIYPSWYRWSYHHILWLFLIAHLFPCLHFQPDLVCTSVVTLVSSAWLDPVSLFSLIHFSFMADVVGFDYELIILCLGILCLFDWLIDLVTFVSALFLRQDVTYCPRNFKICDIPAFFSHQAHQCITRPSSFSNWYVFFMSFFPFLP